ncbi:GNAT family N-acetyltransferase [Pseudoalteromonas sp. DL2-H2.2]|uniref:GNAT family N-acetyltransferase n=1 Tax=Pseudoalteromonas sp. DL2-H2.2 TaxID=2908889 RepID=UPI001F46027D|nr:GNAT family N-acetyltransferase [Pseudoalteromonas sp. DL2-H2.2]MCF2909841.1 GNAT family N-acetyltransferase [Pseudoalteromonas sp. DL2-H2.2]
MKIRKAELTDSEQINKLSVYLGYEIVADDIALKRLSRLLRSDNDNVYVAEIEGEIVGWLHSFKAYRLASDGFNEIGGMVVEPTRRNLGIGKKLVAHALEVDSGKWRVRCNINRAQTHEFYKKSGFKSTKSQHIFENFL